MKDSAARRAGTERATAQPLFKLPPLQDVLCFDKRFLAHGTAPKELLTTNKWQLVVDNVWRWRIRDPLQFYRAAREAKQLYRPTEC